MRATYRTLGAILFGVATVGLGLAFLGSWQRYRTDGAIFVSTAGRYGFTTFDQMIGLGMLTIVCGVVVVSSLFAPRGDRLSLRDQGKHASLPTE
jgi:hypothetical protein